MPKRAPTPPPANDTRFFTVVNPYPEQPYMALEDSKTFARWIACIIGQENLLAFYHKPKSPNVVIVETPKIGPDFGRLMGEHRWRDILRRPTAHEMPEASSIFPCTLTTTRMMEKTGWICRDIPSSWFRKWTAEQDSLITYPYPSPRHCEPPSEDITRFPLCRPIPQAREAGGSQNSDTRRPILPSTAQRASSSTEDLSALSSGFSSDACNTANIPYRFVPAIHGCDVPKASVVFVRPAPISATTPPGSSDADDSDSDSDKAENNLCGAHGVLCVSGICKECAARKREARLAERARQRGGRGRGRRSDTPPKDSGDRPAREHRGAQGRAAEMPAHLRRSAASEAGAVNDPRDRLREDIRVEMAGRRRTGGAKSVASSAARAMPPHLRSGSSIATKSTLSVSSPSSASVSTISSSRSGSVSSHTLACSDDGLSESGDSSALASISDASEDTHSASESQSADDRRCYASVIDVKPRPWGTAANWRVRPSAPVESDAESASTVATDDAAGSQQKHGFSLRPTPAPRELPGHVQVLRSPERVRDSWDDDSSEDEEPF